MAGVKGKSGGARPNAGGTRTGAGRKPKADAKSANGPSEKSANARRSKSANESATSVETSLEKQPRGGALKRSKAKAAEIAERDMLQLLQDVALGRVDASPTQVRAAIAAVQYTHLKKGEGGKKDAKADAAKAAGQGRFGAPPPPPRLVAGGKK